MTKKKDIRITEEQLAFILAEDHGFFQQKILSNCFCNTCIYSKNSVTIVDYQIYINDLNDVVLHSFCISCGKAIGRYLEVGEVDRYLPKIRTVLGLVG